MRVLVHLAYQPPVIIEESPNDRRTQWGMARDLSTTQGAVSKVLDRLGAVGAVQYHPGRVLGRWRRQRIYELTTTGFDLAMRIRRRFRLPDYPPRSGWSLEGAPASERK